MANVLVVDDDVEVLDTLAMMILAGGHTVAKAANGFEALKILEGETPLDLMMTDILMPGLNGIALGRMAGERRPQLKVLYLTGFVEQVKLKFKSGDIPGKLLKKPIRAGELGNEIAHALAAGAV